MSSTAIFAAFSSEAMSKYSACSESFTPASLYGPLTRLMASKAAEPLPFSLSCIYDTLPVTNFVDTLTHPPGV